VSVASENDYEPSGSTNPYGFITKLGHCLAFMDDSNPWSYVVTYLAEDMKKCPPIQRRPT
jgi:hypothetical protein